MSESLNPQQVAALPVRSKMYDTPVGGERGLVVRVHPKSGTKTFRLRYQLDGKRKWISIGEFPATSVGVAKKEARRLHGLIANGRDPALERKTAKRERREQGTVADLAERYLDEYARPRKRSADEDERVLRKELLPRFGELKARELSKGHILEVIDEARKRGVQGGLNNILAIIRKMCRWAVGVDILEDNPTLTIERPWKSVPRDRHLTRDELGQYWAALADASMDYRTRVALQVQALTALRIGEVTGARKIEVQVSDRLWAIPGERIKMTKAHLVPLSDPVADLFCVAIDASPADSPYVFPSDKSDGPIRARSVVRALSRFQEQLQFHQPFTTHDVRRTAATMLIGEKVPHAVVDRVLAHKPVGVLDKHYNLHDYRDEKREALERWATIVLDSAAAKAASS